MTIKDIKLNNIGLKLLMAFIAICPIFYDTYSSRGLRIGQEQFYQLGATMLFAVVMVENIYLSLFLIWSIAIYCYYVFPPIGGNYVMNIFWGCIFYQIAYRIVNQDNVSIFFKTILWVCGLNILWIFLQYIHFDLIYFDTDKFYNTDHVGMLGLKAFMGLFFALAIPFVARFSIWATPILFIPVYLSDCSSAMIGGICGLLFSVWFQSKKAFIALLVLLSIGGSFYVAHDSKMNMFTDRFSVWKVSLRDAFKHPVMGWGLDSFRNVGTMKPFLYFKNYRNNESRAVSVEAMKIHYETGKFPPIGDFLKEGDNIVPWDNPHNEYVQLFYEFGAFGVILFILLGLDIKKRFSDENNLIALVGFFIVILVASIGQFPMHMARIGYLVPIVLGIYYKLTDENENERVFYGA